MTPRDPKSSSSSESDTLAAGVARARLPHPELPQTVGHSFVVVADDVRPEQAHELCIAAVKDHPNGMIPIQTVYELMMKLIGREDVIAAMEEDLEQLADSFETQVIADAARAARPARPPLEVQPETWCDTCTSWRYTTPCGRDDCPFAQQPPYAETFDELNARIKREMAEGDD